VLLTAVKALSVPLPTVTSAAVKPVTDSEKVAITGIGLMLVGLLTVEVMLSVGLVVSTVKVLVLLSVLVLLAASVALAFTECEPSARAEGWVKLQLPAVATVVPTAEPSTMTVTVLPASAVPL
jgi:hypothetical protein